MEKTLNISFRNIFLFGLVLVVTAFSNGRVFSQKVVLTLDTSSIRIGERVQLRLNATFPKSAAIYWPGVADTLTKAIEVSSKSKVDTTDTSRKEFVNYNQILVITSFDTGFHYIPPFSIHYAYAGDTTRHELLSEGVYLKVRAVEVDTTKAIRDIKGPIQAPLTFAEIVPYLGGAAILGLIIGLIWYYFWRKRINKPLFPVLTRTPGPPWETALQSLHELEMKKLWQEGKIKEYYSELTDIIRHYLHQQHGIEAMEMITSEILSAYDTSGLKPESRQILTNILVQADYAKFAKALPLRKENEMSMTLSKQFIEETKPVAALAEPKPAENSTIETQVPEIKV